MVFYGENEFLIWWHGLREFISGFPVGESESPSVNRIVRNLTVRYDMRDGKNYGKDLVAELENLFHFSNATCLTLEIIGEGAADGSDFDTQLLVKEVSSIVKRLIDHFGTRFQIRKGFGSCALLPSPRVFSLTSYWDHPQDSTREKYHLDTINGEKAILKERKFEAETQLVTDKAFEKAQEELIETQEALNNSLRRELASYEEDENKQAAEGTQGFRLRSNRVGDTSFSDNSYQSLLPQPTSSHPDTLQEIGSDPAKRFLSQLDSEQHDNSDCNNCSLCLEAAEQKVSN
ncbi:hypothetical protein TrVFT333_006440 [Trichoderma virens FT-333]|nr:hypothetical protein TrVFT333_006440 [Trichoderma virens FT-333]